MSIGSLQMNSESLKNVISPFKAVADWFKSDARHYQVLFQLAFLLYGIFFLDWSIPLMRLNVVILTCMGVQALWIQFKSKDWTGLKSALISALSICLMLQANSMWTFVIAGVLTIGSKLLIRWNGKHVFNPSNFGITMTVLLTGDAWVSPGQWGSDGLLLFLVGICGLIVLVRVKRLDTAFAFLITFFGLMFVRNIIWLGWPVDFFFHQLNTGSLLLFTFFMITDPVPIPSALKARLLWSVAVGILAFYISTKLWIHTAPLWALVILSPLVPVLDKFFPGPRFNWNK